jgi:hypothetical protein
MKQSEVSPLHCPPVCSRPVVDGWASDPLRSHTLTVRLLLLARISVLQCCPRRVGHRILLHVMDLMLPLPLGGSGSTVLGCYVSAEVFVHKSYSENRSSTIIVHACHYRAHFDISLSINKNKQTPWPWSANERPPLVDQFNANVEPVVLSPKFGAKSSHILTYSL